METEQKKARILCLHGYRQCGKTFKEKLGGFRRLLKTHVEFYFTDAPHLLKNEIGDEYERGWWLKTGENTSCSYMDNFCTELEISIEKIKKVCINDGPFDGLLGFSQGASFAAILCALSIYNFKFVILIAGTKSSIAEHSIYYEKIIKVPSLHIMGNSDTVISKQKSEDLQNCFDKEFVETVVHDGGHYVPANKQFRKNYLNFIVKYLT